MNNGVNGVSGGIGLSGRIETVFTLLSPLSHIGESIGPNSYLATQDMLDAEGNPIEVFAYSGNAIRGMWRDSGAEYMIKKLGGNLTLQIPLELFYLFFSGGAIGGDQSIDIDQARRIRDQIPHLSLFGGGVGNMLLPGKLSVGEGLPVCRELSHIVPEHVPGNRELSCRQMTTEISYSRKDDAKDDLLRKHLQDNDPLAITGQQMTLLADPDEEKKKEKKEKPQQMRYTLEVFCRGAVLWQETFFRDLSEIELGAFVAAIAKWAENPVLGGQGRIGMGRVKAKMTLVTDGEREQFISVGDRCLLGELARGTKARYDNFLERYKIYLEENRDGLTRAISGEVAK